jgi:hypothetical protein
MLPATQNMSGTWRSLVARCTGGAEAAGSNPVVPTIFDQKMQYRMRTQFDCPVLTMSEQKLDLEMRRSIPTMMQSRSWKRRQSCSPDHF